MNEQSIEEIIANPFYCITVSFDFVQPHEPLVTEELWIKANAVKIAQVGAEQYLRELLDILKGTER